MVDVFTFRDGQDRGEERVPQGPPAGPAAAEPSGDAAMDMTHPPLGPLAPYDPRYDPLVAPNPGRGTRLRADLLGRQRRHAAGRRRPDHARHRCRRGDRRLRLHRPGHRAVPGARARHPRHRARSQPQHLGLHQPQRRPGAERERAAVPLAVDRALGQGDRAASSTPRSAPASRRFKSLVAEFPCDAQPGGHLYVAHREKKMDFLRNEAKVMREVFGYDTRMLERRGTAARLLRRGRGLRRAARARRHRRASAEARATATCARRARSASRSIRPAR